MVSLAMDCQGLRNGDFADGGEMGGASIRHGGTMHRVWVPYDAVRVGDEVAVDGIDFVCRVTGKESGMLYVEFDWWYDHEFPARVENEVVDFSRYVFSYLRTPDNQQAPADDWSQVEMAYGINHHGSSDPDPVRSLAFRVLRGDAEACKVVGNLLAERTV